MYPTEVQSWRAALLSGRPPLSRHFLMAIIFNLLNLVQLATLFKLHRGVTPYLGIFLIAIVFFFAVIDYYALLLYRETRACLKFLAEESTEAQSLARLSYYAYRIYLVGLGIGFVVLGFCNLMRR